MDADSWSARLSSVTRRYQAALQSRSDMLMGFEEIDAAAADTREEFLCPFCAEYFDIVGLCCHIDDEHPMESKNGVCSICAMRVGIDMVAHITLHHGNIFKMQRKRKSRKAGSHSTLSMLRRELREGTLQSLFGGSSCIVSSTGAAAAPDPLLSSFILPVTDDFGTQPNITSETIPSQKSLEEKVLERKAETSPMSVKDKEERMKRVDFVRELLMSTVFLDNDDEL
jgi:hypothetical protein